MKNVSQAWKQLVWWQRYLAYIGTVLLLYTLFGFVLVPKIARYVLEDKVAQSIDRKIQVTDIYFNPFTLTTNITSLTVLDKNNNTELAGFDGLHANLKLSSLLQLALTVRDIRLDGPRLHLWLDKNGRTNIEDLTTPAKTTNSTKPDRYLLPLILETVSITNGTVTFEDQAREINHVVNQINFTLPKFSSRQKDWETFMSPTLTFCVNGSPFHLEGQTMPFSNTLRTEFTLQVTHLTLPQYWNYAMTKDNLQLIKGTLDLEMQLVFEQHENSLPTFSIQGTGTGHDIELADENDSVLTLPQIQIQVNDISILNQRLELGYVEIKEPIVKITRHEDKTFNWAEYFISRSVTQVHDSQNTTLNNDNESSDQVINSTQPTMSHTTLAQDEVNRTMSRQSESSAYDSFDNVSGPSLQLQIASINLIKGQIMVQDKSTGFAKNITQLEATITNLDTTPRAKSDFSLALQTADGEEVSMRGDFCVTPFRAESTIEIKALDLPSYAPYFKKELPLTLAKAQTDIHTQILLGENSTLLRLDKGRIDLHDLELEAPDEAGKLTLQQAVLDNINLDIGNNTLSTGILSITGLDVHTAVEKTGQSKLFKAINSQAKPKVESSTLTKEPKNWQVQVQGIDLNNLAVHTPDKTTPVPVKISSAQTEEIKVNLGQQSVQMGLVDLSLVLDIVRQVDGDINILSLLGITQDKKTKPGAKSTNTSPSWNLILDEFALTNSTLTINDQTVSDPLRLNVDQINFKTQNISTDLSKSIPLELSCRVEGTGTIKTTGTLIPSTMTGKGSLKLAKIPLSSATNYIASLAQVQIPTGRLAGTLTWQLADKQGNLAGTLQIDGLKILESHNKKEILGFKTLDIRDLTLHLDPLRLRIGQINILEPRSTVHIDAQGQTPIERVTISAIRPAQTSQVAATTSNGIQEAKIDTINLKQGHIIFLDESIAPAFQTTITPLDMTLTQLSLDPNRESDLSLTAIIDDSASVNIQGKIAPLKSPVEINTNATLRNLNLTALSPYAAKFIAYPITRGHLDWDIGVLTKANTLNMGNKIKAHQFELGDQVDSPDAIDAPVKLGLALLRDVSGDISISLPVKGDLSDPKLSIGGIVIQAFVGLIIKAVASPFTLLTALIPEGSPPLDRLKFAPGLATPTPKTITALQTLADVLAQRPGMNIFIHGHADPKVDHQGLVHIQFYHKLQVVKFDDLSRKEREKTTVDQQVITDEEYGEILWSAYKQEPVDKDKNALGIHREVSREVQEAKLKELIHITENNLINLAISRAEFVKNYLLELGVDPQRMAINPDSSSWSGQAESILEIRSQEGGAHNLP